MLGAWADDEIGPVLRAVLQTAAHQPSTREKLVVETSLMGVTQLGVDDHDRMVRSGLVSSQIMGLAMMRPRSSCPTAWYSRAALGEPTLSVSMTLAGSGESSAIVDAAASFTDDPSGAPATWIQVHLRGHLSWPAGVGYRIVALTPPDAAP